MHLDSKSTTLVSCSPLAFPAVSPATFLSQMLLRVPFLVPIPQAWAQTPFFSCGDLQDCDIPPTCWESLREWGGSLPRTVSPIVTVPYDPGMQALMASRARPSGALPWQWPQKNGTPDACYSAFPVNTGTLEWGTRRVQRWYMPAGTRQRGSGHCFNESK